MKQELFDPSGLFLSPEQFPANTELIGKFVLLLAPDRQILAIGLVSQFGYHADIVEKLCVDSEIRYRRHPSTHTTEILADGYSIQGGGWLKLHHTMKVLQFFGKSTAYGEYSPYKLETIVNALEEVSKGNFRISY